MAVWHMIVHYKYTANFIVKFSCNSIRLPEYFYNTKNIQPSETIWFLIRIPQVPDVYNTHNTPCNINIQNIITRLISCIALLSQNIYWKKKWKKSIEKYMEYNWFWKTNLKVISQRHWRKFFFILFCIFIDKKVNFQFFFSFHLADNYIHIVLVSFVQIYQTENRVSYGAELKCGKAIKKAVNSFVSLKYNIKLCS